MGNLIGAIIEGVIGVVVMTLGYLIWKKEKISLLHEYHYDKVSPEDKKAFCTISGAGVFTIGMSLLITSIIVGITESPRSFLVVAAGGLVGLVMLVYAGIKYNR